MCWPHKISFCGCSNKRVKTRLNSPFCNKHEVPNLLDIKKYLWMPQMYMKKARVGGFSGRAILPMKASLLRKNRTDYFACIIGSHLTL